MRSRIDTLVIAATHAEYLDWCRDNDRAPNDGSRYINHPDQMRGFQCRVVWLRTPWHWSQDQVNEAQWLIRLADRIGYGEQE